MSIRFRKGSRCTYAGVTTESFCPFCQQGLDDADQNEFLEQIKAFEHGEYQWSTYSKADQPADWKPRPHPGYTQMLGWAVEQNRCFKHPIHMKNSYRKHTGQDVDLTL